MQIYYDFNEFNNAKHGIIIICMLAGPFESLRTHPIFNNLRATIRQNPRMLQSVLQDIGRYNPNLLQVRQYGFTYS